MKKIYLIFIIFSLFVFAGCGGGSSKKDNRNEEPDSGETATDEDSDTTDTGQDNDNDIPGSNDDTEDADNGDSSDSDPEEDETDTELVIKATSFGNICTGQTKCFNNEQELTECPAEGSAFYGQDAQYAAKGLCVPQKFSVDSTVKNENIVIDENTGFQWQQTIPEEEFTLEAARQYCDELTYGGHDDWRAPSLIEIQSLFYEYYDFAVINRTYFPPFETQAYYTWGDDFLVALDGGDAIKQYSPDNTALIRCVRGDVIQTLSYLVTVAKSNDDLIVGNFIVKDTATKLIWPHEYATNKTWEEALDYCENLKYAGYDDWRLPNKNELLSLQYSGYIYNSQATAFPDMPKKNFWSSTTAVPYYYFSDSLTKRTMAFSVDFKARYLDHNNKTGTNYVRCVRHPTTPVPDDKPAAEKAVTIGNICTGIKKCYKTPALEDVSKSSVFYSSEISCDEEEAEGQDAQQAEKGKCLPQSFSIDSRVENEKIVVDNNTGLQWQQTIPVKEYDTETAKEYCETLNYGGRDDWRLPTLQELASIIDNSKSNPSIDSDYFPETPTSSDFLTSSKYAETGNSVWSINFGHSSMNAENESYFVRCVRGTKMPVNSFKTSVVKGDLIVKDTVSGLVWAADYNGALYWTLALSYCNNLDYAGHTDWRLPNKNELLSLVNYKKYSPASDFPEMPLETFWSSTAFPYTNPYYGESNDLFLNVFTTTFYSGITSSDYTLSSPLTLAICVR